MKISEEKRKMKNLKRREMMTNIKKKMAVRLLAMLLISGLTLSGNIGAVKPVTVRAAAEKKSYNQVLIPNEECWVYEENDWEDGTVTIKDFNNKAFSGTLDVSKNYQLVIPAKIAGKKVSCVDMESYWLYMRYKDSYVNFTSIKVSEGIETINHLLYDDSNSLSVELPSSVIEIGSCAFYNAIGLTEVIIPPNSKLEQIGYSAFSGCEDLKSIYLPEGVNSLDNQAFYGCDSLKEIVIPASLEYVGEGTFSDCQGLESFQVASGNKYLYAEDGILYEKYRTEEPSDDLDEDGDPIWKEVEKKRLVSYPCAKKSTVTLSADMDFEWTAFINARGLTAIYVDEGNPDYTSVGGVLYTKDMVGLLVCPAGKTGEYTVPEGVCYMQTNSFSSSALTAIRLPDTLYNKYDGKDGFVGNYSFYQCDALKTIHLGKNVPSEICNQLYDAKNLTNITVSEANANLSVVNNVLYDKDVKTLIFIPSGLKGKVILPDSVETSSFRGEDETAVTVLRLGKAHKVEIKIGYDDEYEDEAGNLIQTDRYEKARGVPNFRQLEAYEVSPDNKTLTANKGLLYSKDLKTLYLCPTNKKGIVTLPTGVEKILSTAFKDYVECFIGDDVPSLVMNLAANQNTVEKVSKIWKLVADYEYTDIVVKDAAGKILTGKNAVQTGCVISLMRGSGKDSYPIMNIRCVLNKTLQTKPSPTIKPSSNKNTKLKKPGKVTGLKVKNKKKKKIVVKWRKKTNVSGYQIQYALNKKFTKKKKSKWVGKKKSSKTISKLKKGKKYYIRVRAYRKKSGKKLYGKWSKVKKVKIKK